MVRPELTSVTGEEDWWCEVGVGVVTRSRETSSAEQLQHEADERREDGQPRCNAEQRRHVRGEQHQVCNKHLPMKKAKAPQTAC